MDKIVALSNVFMILLVLYNKLINSYDWDKLEEELRKVSLPIIARISKERMLFDVRTIDERHFEYINETLRKLCK